MSNARRIVLFSRTLAILAAAIVVMALVGYATHALSLVQVSAGLQGMSPFTAIGLLALAMAAVAATLRRGRLVRAASSIAAAIGLAVLISHLLFGSEVFSRPIGTALFDLPAAEIGRTSVATALTVTMLAAALVVRRRWSFWSDVLAGVSTVVSGTALLGYLYGVGDLYALPMFNSMALNTATALLFLSLAVLCAVPELGWASVVASDDIGGGATRRQLSFVALPIIAGWGLLQAIGMRGVGPAIAMALLVIITVVPLAILVLRDGRVLNALSRERRDSLARQRHLTDEMATQLKAQAEDLARAAAERAKSETTLHQAQRMEAVGQLTSGIAHDFNNLLMAIRGNLELLERRLPPGDQRLQNYVERATSAADRGAKITGQLLAFSRIQRLDIRSIEANPTLLAACDLVERSLGPTITLTLDLDTTGLWVLSDPAQLELAILNLAVNARDAMPAGGTLRIESRPHSEAASDASPPVDYVAIRIIDDGSGMSPEIAARAVEPFFTTKEFGKGTGLGLAQVYGFVRQCGGDLRITSAPGAGTTVELLLPQSRGTQAQLATSAGVQPPDAQARPTGETVLVIDDDDMVRMVIVEALIDAGFVVVEASDGASGLALLGKTHPAAAVIDFIMPGMNGAEVARRAQIMRPGLPIIFVSGYSDTLALEGISGAVVLRKPFDVDGLSRALNSVLH